MSADRVITRLLSLYDHNNTDEIDTAGRKGFPPLDFLVKYFNLRTIAIAKSTSLILRQYCQLCNIHIDISTV